MKAQFKKYLFLLLPLIIVSFSLNAQTNYKLTEAVFTVAGTSSLHDWTMDSKTATGEAAITTEGNALKSIEKLNVSLNAETLKSGKSGMDTNAYKALDTKKNPNISFNIKQIKSIAKKGNRYLIEAEGSLTVAGETKLISVQGEAYPVNGTLKITGDKKFKMTDFKVDPPTALMGTVKTGDEITINFNLTYKI